MPKFLANIDLQKNQLLNATIQNLASAPSSPVAGQIYYNTADNKLYVYNGSVWIDASSVTRLKGSSGGTAAYTTGDINLVGGSNVTVTQVGSTFTFDVSMPSSSIAFNGDVVDVSGSTGSTITLTLENTGVVAGTYGSGKVYPFTVDSKGRITDVGVGVDYQPYDEDLYQIGILSGTSGLLKKTGANSWALDTTAYGTGSVTSVALSLPNIFSVSGSPITTGGTLSATLSNQSSNQIFAGPTTGGGAAPAFRSLVNADLPESGVSAGTYKSVTVNSKGVITSGTNPTTLSGYGITDAIDTSSTGQTKAGSLAVTGGVIADLTGNASTAAALQTARTIALSGDASGSVSFDGSAGVTISTTLANTGVASGTYGSGTAIPIITVDSKGRVTAASTASISTSLNISADAGTGTVSLGSDTFKIAGGTGITTTVIGTGSVDTIEVKLKDTSVSAGSYGGATQVGGFTVDAQGRLTSASNTAIAAATLTGDISNVSVTPGATTTVTLNTVNSNTGTFGTANAIPVITVNGKGLVTAVSTVAPRIPSLNEVTGIGATSAAAITITNTTQSTNTTSGALIVDGGLGVAKNLNIGGNLTVGGNFTVNGTFSTIGVSTLEITDPIIYLAAGNTTSNIDDIGFVGNYNDGTYAHTGLVKRATDGLWYLFSGVTFEPGATVNFSSYTVDTIKANVQGNLTGNVTGNVSGRASYAENIVGGAAGSIPYQSGASTTTFVAAGTSGTFFKSQGSAAPIWTSVTKSDVGLSNVENTALSTWAGSTYLTTVASNLALPGSPTTTTQAAGTSTTTIATTGFVSIAVANGTSTLDAKTDKYATSIGNGASLSFVVTHSLGSQDVQVTVRETASPYAIVYPDVELTSTNTCTVYFGSAPSNNAYRVIVVG